METNCEAKFSCRKKKHPPIQPLTTSHVWESKRERTKESVTLVTQLSLERIAMLRSQCTLWPDRIAAAVYAPVFDGKVISFDKQDVNGTSLEDAKAALASLHAEREQYRHGCALDLSLIVEHMASIEDSRLGLYPFNAARNKALALAQTEAVLLLDVDFLPSPDLASAWMNSNSTGYEKLMDDLNAGSIYVVPAFETSNDHKNGGKADAIGAVKGGKPAIVAAFKAGNLVGFQLKQYSPGHSRTNFKKWVDATEPYTVNYKKGFEPYILAARKKVPWYDERFRGYGQDKKVHLLHMARKPCPSRFVVHPSGFVVHVPHRKAATMRVTKLSGQWDRLYDLYVSVQNDINKGSFTPYTSFSCD